MNTSDDRTLTAVLERVAQEARPASLSGDLWSRGRRRHRRRVAAAVAVAAALASVVAMPLVDAWGWRPAVSPANDQPSVPSRVFAPLPLQSTVQDAPPGPATVILTAPGGFGASDLFGYEDRALVVGRNGSYRMVRHVDAFDAGQSLLLSPDGRFVAGNAGLEGTQPSHDPSAATSVLDLTTGLVSTYDAGEPLAWLPDGNGLLTWGGHLRVLELDSGIVDDLVANGAGHASATPVAFSPDGRWVALQVGLAVHIVDLAAGTQRKLADLGDRRILAGPGAWTADGHIAIWQFDCGRCRTGEPVAFDLAYVDAERGTDVGGPRLETIHALGARLLGWQSDGDAVVVLYRDAGTSGETSADGQPTDAPPWQITDAAAPFDAHAEVVALHPGGGSTTLVTLPGAANRVDVARDLLDRFGGAPASPPARLLDWLLPLSDEIALLAGIAAAIYTVRLVRRRVRTGFWQQFPGGTRRRVEFPRRF